MIKAYQGDGSKMVILGRPYRLTVSKKAQKLYLVLQKLSVFGNYSDDGDEHLKIGTRPSALVLE